MLVGATSFDDGLTVVVVSGVAVASGDAGVEGGAGASLDAVVGPPVETTSTPSPQATTSKEKRTSQTSRHMMRHLSGFQRAPIGAGEQVPAGRARVPIPTGATPRSSEHGARSTGSNQPAGSITA